MTHHDKARKLVERLNDTLGGVQVSDLMHGDNLAITLCTAYDNPDQDTDDETGWTPDAISGQEAVLAAIRAHYAPLADLITALSERVRVLEGALVNERIDNLWNAYHSGYEKDGRWTHCCMSDGEWLARECGFDPSEREYDAEAVKAAIPKSARAALSSTGEDG